MTDINALIGETDASKWAKEFVALSREYPHIARNEDTMIAWFAGAIAAGREAGLMMEKGSVHD